MILVLHSGRFDGAADRCAYYVRGAICTACTAGARQIVATRYWCWWSSTNAHVADGTETVMR